jgi:hypothetical protein
MANPVKLDDVLISKEVWDAWNTLAVQVIASLPAGVSPQDIDNEEAEKNADGSLTLFCRAKGQRIAELRVPRDH